MAWQTSKRVWDFAHEAKQNDKLMLLALADISDEHGICWPQHNTSYDRLAQMVGVQRRSAMRLVDHLVEMNYVIKLETIGRGNSNHFIVTVGLAESEVQNCLKLVEDSVNSYPKKVTPETPFTHRQKVTTPSPKQKKVTPETRKGVTPVTISPIKGDTPVTHTIFKDPSLPSLVPNGTEPPSKKSKPKAKKSREPPSPAFQKYIDIAGTYQITNHWRDKMAETVGDKPEDLEFWGKVVEGYTGNGWNKLNVKLMLEYFERREIPEVSRNGAKRNGHERTQTPRNRKPGIIQKTGGEAENTRPETSKQNRNPPGQRRPGVITS